MAAAAEVGPPAAWDGTGTQEDLMYRDQVLVLDDRDNIVGAASKWDSHRFEGATPTGMLHRAFSVFLFDAEGKLLLQQRASDKITLPDVWTNTCCTRAVLAPPVLHPPESLTSPRCLLGPAEGENRGRVRPASAGEGAECTASGVSSETFWPGDLAFPQISAPPRPLCSPSRTPPR